MRWIPLVALAAALTITAAEAPAAPPGPELHDSWVARIAAAREAVETARVREAASLAAYSRMRSSNRARGARRVEVREQKNQAIDDLRTAERQLDEVIEEARRAGVPPGWVREAMQGFVESSPARAD